MITDMSGYMGPQLPCMMTCQFSLTAHAKGTFIRFANILTMYTDMSVYMVTHSHIRGTFLF